MNKFLSAILITAAGIGAMNAQTKVMKIEYKDGTTELKKVTDVQRITFADEGDVPEPSDKMVDLGLSVKWAPFNIGAKGSTEVGDYICWGELYAKQYSHVYNYKWYDPLTDGYIEIGDQISDTDYDPAKVLWGDGWRLPTEDEIKELIEKCTWVADNNGYTVTGPNGNSIYLPACGMQGYRGLPTGLSRQSGYYMAGNADVRTNSKGEKMTSTAACLRFARGSYNVLGAPQATYFSKAGGIQIRPVHE